MGNFKKTLFGGYKKNSVDAAMDEINKKLADSENNNVYLKHVSEESSSKILELEKKLSELAAENAKLQGEKAILQGESAKLQSEKAILQGESAKLQNENAMLQNESTKLQSEKIMLQSENASLKTEQSKNNYVFSSLEKIYKRAYGTGYDIVNESKDITQDMLDKINESFAENLGDSEKIMREYESIHSDIEKMFSLLSSEISSVHKNADAMLKKAKRFMGVYGEMKTSLQNVKAKNEIILSQFEADTSEFINNYVGGDMVKAVDPVDNSMINGLAQVPGNTDSLAKLQVITEQPNAFAEKTVVETADVFAKNEVTAPISNENKAENNFANVNADLIHKKEATSYVAPAEKKQYPEAPARFENYQEQVIAIKSDNYQKPVIEVQPRQPQAPVAEAQPEQYEAPVAEAQPEQYETPVAEAQPEQNEAPVAEAQPEQNETPVAEAQPEQNEAPVVEAQPEQNEAPVAEAQPEQYEAPVAEAQPEQNETDIPKTTAAVFSKTSTAAAVGVAAAINEANKTATQENFNNAHSNNGFTQFGRKSRVTSQDRNELLRKALLKSGANK